MICNGYTHDDLGWHGFEGVFRIPSISDLFRWPSSTWEARQSWHEHTSFVFRSIQSFPIYLLDPINLLCLYSRKTGHSSGEFPLKWYNNGKNMNHTIVASYDVSTSHYYHTIIYYHLVIWHSYWTWPIYSWFTHKKNVIFTDCP